MPPIITNLPWLSRDSDPVQAYQRSQQLVQQMQAQQAQERQQQAELAQRARESAMQASFQQRSLALKEQEAKSSVQVEADRLRQKGQALEFEQKQDAFRNELLSRPPEAVNLPGMPPGVMAGGRYYPGQRAPVDQTKATAVHIDNDPNKPLLGYDVGGAFQALRTAPTAEEKGRAAAEKAQAAEARQFNAQEQKADRFNRDELIRERTKLERQIVPGSSFWEEATEEQRAQTTGRLAEIQRGLDTYRAAPKKAEPLKPAKQVLAEERAKLANKIESENPTWNQGQVMKAVYDAIP